MKRILILLLSLTLCLGGLTACGSDKKNDAVNNGPGSGSMPEGALNNGTVGENPADSRNDADAGSDAARAGRTSTCTTEGETLFRPASYRQMLRNARVHDLDGDLTDGENSVTPGVLH